MQATLTQYTSFVLKDQVYAIPVKWVREIIKLPKVTKVPLSPDYIEGISNLRGEIFTIINLKKRLGIGTEILENSKVIVIEKDSRTFGIIVDKTSQVMDVEENNIEVATASNDFVKKVIRMEDNIYMVLELDKLVENIGVRETDRGSKIMGGKAEASRESESIQENYIQIVTFEMNGEFYGFVISDVQEIIRYKIPNEIPNMPEYVKGIMDLRDSVLPIVDLRIMLGIPATEPDEFTKVIVLKVGKATVGFIVDRIKEVLRISESSIKNPPSIIRAKGRNEIEGIIKENNETIMLLKTSALIPSEVVEFSENIEEIEEKSDKTLISEKQYVIFLIGEEHYGVSIENIREINRLADITKIPRAPEFVEGIMNLRGEVLPIIDLRKRFGTERFDKNDSTRIIVTDISNKRTGFIVDHVVGVEKIPDDSITEFTHSLELGRASEFVKSVARLRDKLVLILEVERILSEAEEKQLKKVISRVETKDENSAVKTKAKDSKNVSKGRKRTKKLKRSE